jgi:hypothetical protein
MMMFIISQRRKILGGAEALLDAATRVPDVSNIMVEGPHAHSANAYILLENYKVGEMDDAECTNKPEAKFKLVNGIPLHSYKDDTLIDWSKPIFWQVCTSHILAGGTHISISWQVHTAYRTSPN